MTWLARYLGLAVFAAACATAYGPADAKAHGKVRVMADGYSRAALQVLARARAASGGSGWNMLRGWHIAGRQGAARFEIWIDPVRFGMRTEIRDAMGLRVEGFNGQGAWRLPAGPSPAVYDKAAADKARTQAFLAANGFFYPGRFEAHGELLGVRSRGGHTFEVLNVQPWGGTARELWFDARSHLLARVVDATGPQPVVTEFSDYRRVGPVSVAFHTKITGPDPSAIEDRQTESVVFTPADRDLFSLPRPDAAPAP